MKHDFPRLGQQATLRESVQQYLTYLQSVRKLETNSVTHYGNDLSLFVRFVERVESAQAKRVPASRLTAKHVADFLHEQTMRRGNGSASNRRRLSCLRGFFRYLGEHGIVSPDLVIETPMPAPPKRKLVVLTPAEVKAFLAAIETSAPYPVRDEAIFRTFLSCGCRLSELLRLRWHDIDIQGGWIRFSSRPGKSRIVPLPKQTGIALARYADKRPKAASDRLFLNRHREPITKGAVYHSFQKCISAAGIQRPGITVHTLRNTFLVRTLKESTLPMHHLWDIAGVRTQTALTALLKEAALLREQFEDQQ